DCWVVSSISAEQLDAGASLRIDHKGRSALEVVVQRAARRLDKAGLVDRRQHMADPGVALGLTDREGRMAHAQPRVATLLIVTRRAAKILSDKQKLALFAGLQIGRKQRAQQHIALDTRIKAIDQAPKWPVAAGQFVDTRLVSHAAIINDKMTR